MGSKRGFKTYSGSTTIRNIERVADLLRILIEIDNEGNLTFEIGNRSSWKSKQAKISIVKEIIARGWLTSTKVPKEISEKIENGEILSLDEVDIFMDNARQKPGWDGRFSNYMNKLEPLGLAFRNYENGKIEITKLGHKFLENPEKVVEMALTRIPSSTPFSRRKNMITPAGVVAKFIKITEQRFISNGAFAVLLSLHDFDSVDEFARNQKNLNLLNYAAKISEGLKEKTIDDYRDEVGRTFVFAQLFKKGFQGYEVTDYFFSNLDKYITDSKIWMDKLNSVNSQEFVAAINSWEIETILLSKETTKINAFNKKSKEFSFDVIVDNIRKLTRREVVQIEGVDKEVRSYVLAEWLWAILLSKIFDKAKPNLILTSHGLPISQATGNNADIVVEHSGKKINFEITLITSRTQQINSETTNLARHAKSESADGVFLIAPKIHDDTKNWFEYEESRTKLKMRALTFEEVISKMQKSVEELLK